MSAAAVVALKQGQGSRRSRLYRLRVVQQNAVQRAASAVTPLAGPAVVITGASQGVGRALSERFARLGYHIVLVARSEGPLEGALARCRSALQPGREAVAVACDITSEASVLALHAAVTARFADVRVVICNAGVCMSGSFLDHTAQDFQDQMGVNFLGHVTTARAFLPDLLELARQGARGQKPSLCFVNGIGGRMPLPNMTAYCAAKYALQGFADALRLEIAQSGVHVGTVHPGVIRSDFRQRAQFRGDKGEQQRKSLDALLDGASLASQLATQSVEEVANAVVSAVELQKPEVVVGLVFQALIGSHGVAKVVGVA